MADGNLVTLVVQSTSDDSYSRVYLVSELRGAGTVPTQTELLAVHDWLTSIWCQTTEHIIAVSDEGQAHHFNGETWSVREVAKRALTHVFGLGPAQAFAVGDAGIVFYWDGKSWQAISPPLGEKLFSIHGTSENDLHVCGNNGGFWRRSGTEWHRIDLRTNARLTSVLVISKDEIWVCGLGGLLFSGSGAAWQEQLLAPYDLHGITHFQGNIYLAGSVGGVYRLDGDNLFNVKNTVISYGLISNGPYMASRGDKIAIRFDGNSWAGVRYD